MKLKLIGDRILVRRVEGPEKIGAVIMPDSIRERSYQGEVMYIGEIPDARGRVCTWAQPGQIVLFTSYATLPPITVDGEDLIPLRESDAYAILEE